VRKKIKGKKSRGTGEKKMLRHKEEEKGKAQHKS